MTDDEACQLLEDLEACFGIEGAAEATRAGSIMLAAAWLLKAIETSQAVALLFRSGASTSTPPLRRLVLELCSGVIWVAQTQDHRVLQEALEAEHKRERLNLAKTVGTDDDSWDADLREAAAGIAAEPVTPIQRDSDLAIVIGQTRNLAQLLRSIQKADWYAYYRVESGLSHLGITIAAPYLDVQSPGHIRVGVAPQAAELRVVVPCVELLAMALHALNVLHPLPDLVVGWVETAEAALNSSARDA